MGEWLPLAGLTVLAVLYGRGALAHRADGRRAGRVVTVAAAAGGIAAAAVALGPPLHAAAERTFAAHMVQHVLLIAVAAPLFVLADPGRILVVALPVGARRALARHRVRPSSHWAAWAAVAVAVQAAVMWTWHAPVLYEGALRSEAVHAAEHLTLLGTSVWAWWGLIRMRRSRRGAAALALFVGAFPGTALGAALLLAPDPWYGSYVHGSSTAALGDQQLAAVVMWSVTGIAYVIGAAVLFGTWLADADRRERLVALGEGEKYAY